jgi:hypothetical protein
MTWEQKKWITITLGSFTFLFAASGATGTWWPTVICGIALVIGLASMLQHWRANRRP